MSRFFGRSVVFKSIENMLSEEQIGTLGRRALAEGERHFSERPYDRRHAETVVFDAKVAPRDAPQVTVRIVVVRRERFQLDAYIGLKEEVIAFFEQGGEVEGLA